MSSSVAGRRSVPWWRIDGLVSRVYGTVPMAAFMCCATRAQPRRIPLVSPPLLSRPQRRDRDNPGIIAIAASLGGLRVIEEILAVLPVELPVPLVIVQHLADQGPSSLVDILSGKSGLPVRWLTDGDRLSRGVAYVAPMGRHAVLRDRYRAALVDTPRINHSRPAADPLFTSAATTYGSDAIAVVLTGRLFDGALGALAVRRAGGVVIAQEPTGCEAPGMPQAAIRAGAVHFVLPPLAIASALIALTMMPGAPAMFGWPTAIRA